MYLTNIYIYTRYTCHIYDALSHENCMLTRIALIEALLNMRGYFKPFEIKGSNSTPLFHPNSIPNLKKMKSIFILEVKMSPTHLSES